jgi:hypothetical protein
MRTHVLIVDRSRRPHFSLPGLNNELTIHPRSEDTSEIVEQDLLFEVALVFATLRQNSDLLFTFYSSLFAVHPIQVLS